MYAIASLNHLFQLTNPHYGPLITSIILLACCNCHCLMFALIVFNIPINSLFITILPTLKCAYFFIISVFQNLKSFLQFLMLRKEKIHS